MTTSPWEEDGMQWENWVGMFTRHQAEGAIPNGTRVVKTASEKNDANANGTPGVVLGSMRHPDLPPGLLFYFVEWASTPKVAVGCMGYKLRVADL